MTMVGPGGARHPCCGEYLDVVPPALLVFTNDATDDSDNVIIQGLTRVSFEEYEGDKTQLTLTTRASALIEPMVNGLMGMQAGWSQSLDKLFELVAQG